MRQRAIISLEPDGAMAIRRRKIRVSAWRFLHQTQLLGYQRVVM
jgi:hypothetical protein